MSTTTELPERTKFITNKRSQAILGIIVFTMTALVGASLLFAVEPMVAKMLLPTYGGSPMVWNTAVLFFQAALLAGYAYAHWSQRKLGVRWQPIVQIALVALPLLALPIALPAWAEAPESAPTGLWLLAVLAVMVGTPFVVVATTGPLVQRWYSWSGLPRSDDPYFLYAASNVGSLAALLAYPFLIEPAADLTTQSRWWSMGYGAFAALMIASALFVRFAATRVSRPSPEAEPESPEKPGESTGEENITWRRRLRWTGLAFIPSSLMLGVTTHISTDVAPVPLIWIVPLALYLITFIVAFGATPQPWLAKTVLLAAVCGPVLPWILLFTSMEDALSALPFDLALVLVAGLACHGLLAADRPTSRGLTEFFLIVSAGGVLGGVFNGLLAPVVFNWVAELPLVIVGLAALPFLAGRSTEARLRFSFFGYRTLSRLFLITTPTVASFAAFAMGSAWIALAGAVAIVVWGFFAVKQPRMLALSAVLTIGLFFVAQAASAPIRERTFFGSYKVAVKEGRRIFSHGTTIHGYQLLDDEAARATPVSYYSRRGPMGDIFGAYGDQPIADRVAVVGLGAGGLAAHGRVGQQMDFYEIDPAVIKVARDSRLFTYLRDCRCTATTIAGDGRLRLQEASDGGYGMIILDAFTSDAVPTHLLTREAIRLYVEKLRPGGVLVFNVTNRNLDLAPMLGATARVNGLAAVTAEDHRAETRESLPSEWVVVARTEADLEPLRRRNERWQPIRADGPVWTDTYSSLLGVLHLGRR